jgi:hypothetical protein
MLNKLTLALTASLSAQATAEEKKQPPTAPPQKHNAIFCNTASLVAPFMGATLTRGI